jgi:hypothetical protein
VRLTPRNGDPQHLPDQRGQHEKRGNAGNQSPRLILQRRERIDGHPDRYARNRQRTANGIEPSAFLAQDAASR